MRFSSIIIAIIVCAGIAGFIFRNDIKALISTSSSNYVEKNEAPAKIENSSKEIKDFNKNTQKSVSVLVQKSNEQE
ncbi:hypothetical protein N9W59_00605, partial [Amylibacter sp.]|nr:hypothetical protein [Amylibacter sp.]